MRQSVNIWFGFFFPYNVNAVKLSWSTAGAMMHLTQEMQVKSHCFDLQMRAHFIVQLTHIFYVFVSFFIEWVVSQTNWKDDDDNALVPRELLFSFHAKIDCFAVVAVLFGLWIVLFRLCTPACASNNSIFVWAEAEPNEWMCDSCASLMMHFFSCWQMLMRANSQHINFFFNLYISRLHYSWRPNALKVYSTCVCARALLNQTFYILVDFVYIFCFFSVFHLCFYFNLLLIRCALVSLHTQNRSRMNEIYVNEHENCTFHFKLH